jgi:hypothetical protein
VTPGGGPGLRARGSRLAAIVLWGLGALVIWNSVFDAHIVRGARDYVDRQRLFADGRGPRVDIDQAMDAAKSEGLRAAWSWTGVELAAGAAIALGFRLRSRDRGRDATPGASR